jgi:hypothetical protein
MVANREDRASITNMKQQYSRAFRRTVRSAAFNRAIYLMVLFVVCSNRQLFAFQSSNEASESSLLVESLVNKSIRSPDRKETQKNLLVISEDSRIREILQRVGDNPEIHLDSLREYLADNRYCITWTDAFGKTKDATIGDVFHDILGSALSEPFYERYRDLPTGEPKLAYNLVSTFFLRMSRKSFVSWLEKRKGLTLFELQIDAGMEIEETLLRNERLLHERPEGNEFPNTVVELKGLATNVKIDIESLKSYGSAKATKWHGLRRFP